MRPVIFLLAMMPSVALAAEAGHLADVPIELREPNYDGGSCAHASMVTAFRYLGFDEWADWWRATYSGGEVLYGHIEKLKDTGVRFAYTESGDMRLLDWAARNRLPVVVYHVPVGHAQNIVNVTDTTVTFLDNNNVGRYWTMSRHEFIKRWNSPGWALVLVYAPPAPWPQ